MRASAQTRVAPRLALRVIGVFILLELLFLLALSMLFTAEASAAEPLKGEISVSTSGGYARLIFRMEEEADAEVRQSGGIVIVSFNQPVDIPLDRIVVSAPDYISAARRDPDGKAIRFALARRAKANLLMAAERLFLDFIPEGWTGPTPSLPDDVAEELNRRTREAERLLRAQRQVVVKRKEQNYRVKVGTQPTFTRYLFEVPDDAGVIVDRSDDKFTLRFNQPIRYDLTDAKAALPATIQSVESEVERDTSSVNFVLQGKIEIRNFREENNYVVDVSTKLPKQEAKPEGANEDDDQPAEGEAKDGSPKIDAPATIPANAGDEKSNPPEKAASPALTPAPKAMAEPAPAAPAKPAMDAPPKPAADAAPKAPAEPAASKPKMAADTPPAAEPKAKAEAAMPPAAPAAAPAPPAPAATPARPAAPAASPPADKPKLADTPPPAAERPVPSPPGPNAPVKVELRRQGESLSLAFPFGGPTPAAVFRRADALWLVFDTPKKIDLGAFEREAQNTARSAAVTRPNDDTAVVRIKLERPRLISVIDDGPGWIVNIGDTITTPTRPLGIARNIVGLNRASITIPIEEPRKMHRLTDPDMGDTLLVVTALAPARGLLKPQDFVELRALGSSQGIAVQPYADDLTAELAPDKVVISRPNGLTLSAGSLGRQASSYHPLMFDTQLWGFDRQAAFNERQSELLRLAAAAPESKRNVARLALARFYLARDLYPEAKAVLDVALSDDKTANDDATGIVLKSVANVMLNRADEALKDLSSPTIGNQHDAPIWRALAYERQGKWAESRDGFRGVEAAMGTLPVQLQRIALQAAIRASIEVKDFAAATKQLNEFETIGIPHDMEPSIAILSGRLAEGLGRSDDALTAYRLAVDSPNRRASAQARLREIVLRYGMKDLKRPEAIAQLETLTTSWRGDETEIEGLQLLAHLYTEENRYRDAFHVMRTALLAHPNSDMTRRIHDEAAATFDNLFLAGKGDTLPAVEALGLFYDFRELTPIGRRGDEMIRRLADRLVAVDLLDQAAELLQHQVDHRLQGAARAQVATRLAVIYLMNRKPDRALATLRATRTAELSNELRDQRLLIETRALSDIGRHELALELIANMNSREAIRLRSDVLWSARRWGEAAEQIELMYGERWKDFEPLTDLERPDILRAAIGYALSDDAIGLARFREKYAAKMAEGPDQRAFEVVTAPLGTSGAEFMNIAKTVAAVDTLDGFLRELRKRYPDTATLTAPAAGAPEQSAAPKPGANAAPAGNTQPAANAATPETPAEPKPRASASPPATQKPANESALPANRPRSAGWRTPDSDRIVTGSVTLPRLPMPRPAKLR